MFIDGSNFYHGMKSAGLPGTGLNYARLSEKLTAPREWVETRFYVGNVRQKGDRALAAGQQRFLARLSRHPRIFCFLGRVESRPAAGAAKELTRWLNLLPNRRHITVSAQAVKELRGIAGADGTQWVEKAVDVMIATDMISMAHEGKYDDAYLLSADGDFTHAVKKVRETGRKVFVASPVPGAQLAQAATAFISLRPDFFHDCWE